MDMNREIKSADSMTEEELMAKHMRGLAEIEAGGGIHKTLAELEAMAENIDDIKPQS